MNKTTLLCFTAALALMAGPALGQVKVKIGFVNTFSGPNATIGNDMRDAFELALDHLGRKMGGVEVEAIYEDDQQKPDVGKQKTEKLIQSDKVNFLTGYIWSNVLLASVKSAIDSQTFLISGNAGPSQLAGELCNPYFFSASWQNDQTPMAMGEALNQRGIKKIFIMAPNYAAGKDMAAGVKSTFKGEVVGEEYTKWPDQLDFSAELSKVRAARPDALFVFYPGAAGVQILNQYTQAGLKAQVPFYSAYTIDAITLPLQKDNALGALGTQSWVNDLQNEANKKFVADFRKKYNRMPSFYAAQQYDAVMLIDSAVRSVKGALGDKDGIRAALRKADFKSVRGEFKFNQNHFPVQNFYLQETVREASGELNLKTIATVFKDHKDLHQPKCPMKW
ncbi:MAG: ABC transporter substrate-binding protein [Alphaproteobacteria bacterium]|nr:ABC transporter substrate-binding protein [Alphaproteobacteria bacterium]